MLSCSLLHIVYSNQWYHQVDISLCWVSYRGQRGVRKAVADWDNSLIERMLVAGVLVMLGGLGACMAEQLACRLRMQWDQKYFSFKAPYIYL